ncbi:MAG: ATP-binding cassette domain-containing protein [Anaerolineae bacterium]|jgi:hypothetical protein
MPKAKPKPGRDLFVRLAGLSKAFREGDRRRTVLREASAEFARGEFVAILGKSGSGKSTLLNLISGIDLADGRAPAGRPGAECVVRLLGGGGAGGGYVERTGYAGSMQGQF